jgi:hypothetical protein
MEFEPKAHDLDLVDVESALLRAAVGDYTAEAAILLLANFGHWLPQLQTADLISLEEDAVTGIRWAQIQWGDLDQALTTGLIFGSSGELRVLRAAASLVDDQPVDLGDLASGLDRRSLTLLLAAIAHAGGSHEHREEATDPDSGITYLGDKVPPLLAWPART